MKNSIIMQNPSQDIKETIAKYLMKGLSHWYRPESYKEISNHIVTVSLTMDDFTNVLVFASNKGISVFSEDLMSKEDNYFVTTGVDEDNNFFVRKFYKHMLVDTISFEEG